MTGRIAGGGVFAGEKLMWHRGQSSGVMQSAAAVALMPLVILCGEHHSYDSQCFLVGWTSPKNCPFSLWIWTSSNTCFLGLPDSPGHHPPKRYLRPFIRFWRAHERDRQTDRRTDRPRYCVCSNRPHMLHAMPPNNITVCNTVFHGSYKAALLIT